MLVSCPYFLVFYHTAFHNTEEHPVEFCPHPPNRTSYLESARLVEMSRDLTGLLTHKRIRQGDNLFTTPNKNKPLRPNFIPLTLQFLFLCW